MGSIPGLEKSLGRGNGNPFQYSCLGNPKDRGAQRATAHGVAELDMTEQLRMTVRPGQHGPGDRQAPAGGLLPPSVLCTSVFMALPPLI